MRLYLVILYYGGSESHNRVLAETYLEAITKLHPGNDALRVEAIELGSVEDIVIDIEANKE